MVGVFLFGGFACYAGGSDTYIQCGTFRFGAHLRNLRIFLVQLLGLPLLDFLCRLRCLYLFFWEGEGGVLHNGRRLFN